MQDTQFLQTKWEVMEKVGVLLSKLQLMIDKSRYFKPKIISQLTAIQFPEPKISRGENYNGLPYMVLDHPRFFSQDSTLTFRSMFLWGEFWSFTLQLQGNIFNKMKDFPQGRFALANPVYVSNGETPWEYFYDESNYKLFPPNSSSAIKEHIYNRSFAKFSEKIPVTTVPDEVTAYGFAAYERLMKILIGDQDQPSL